MRYYNGCPDSKLKAVLDNRSKLERELRLLNKDAMCTYYPLEGFYICHIWGKAISKSYSNAETSLNEAIKNLKSNLILTYA